MARYSIYSNQALSSRMYMWYRLEYDGKGQQTVSEYVEQTSAQFQVNISGINKHKIVAIYATLSASTVGSGKSSSTEIKIDNQTVFSESKSSRNYFAIENLAIDNKDAITVTFSFKSPVFSQVETSDYKATRYSWASGDVAYNYESGRTFNNVSIQVVYEADLTADAINPLAGENIARSLENAFSWVTDSPASPIVGKILYWKYKNDVNYKAITINVDADSYIFPPYFFDLDDIDWYIEIEDGAGYKANSSVQTVRVGITPEVQISYPNDVNIRNGNIQIFTWEMKESIPTGQKSYEIQYKAESENTWTVIEENSPNQYHEFPADTFITDNYQWKLKVTNNDEISTEYVEAEFHSIGSTNAPDIKRITNSSIPTIFWEIDSQDTFELEIYQGEERIYVSGIQVGSGIRSFTPNIMLEDGNYIVKMRAMNEYGYFTQWSDYSFVLAPPKPQEVECMAYANAFHGINVVLGSGNPSRLYVMRRRFGDTAWDMLGRLISGEIFTDNSVLTDVKYEYALRNYEPNAGFTDSNIVSMVINYKGSLIYDKNEFVELYKTEDEQFNISHAPSKSYTYSYAIGRKYPVRESSEWMSHSTNLSCFVTYEQYEKLEEFYESNDDLWFKGDNFTFKCSIDSLKIKETLLGKGYTIDIDLSRTDENEVNLLE